jgi:hypothetical protein
MWSFSTSDLAEGAQEKVVAASDFRGPKKERRFTNFSCLVLLVLCVIFCGFCVIYPSFVGSPDPYKLIYGTDYSGRLCKGATPYLYPIHPTGVGACVATCPTQETARNVDGFDVNDKKKMVCMQTVDFLKFSKVGTSGITDFSKITPIVAFKYGVCNYQYRTFVVGNRCYFRDGDVAKRYPYQLPASMVVTFAQSFYECRYNIIFFNLLGPWILASGFLYFLQSPLQFSEKKGADGDAAQAARAITAVWVAIWTSGAALLLMGSHMWYTAAYYTELAVDPHLPTESLALQITAVILWCLGALWLWTMLRVRHAVTLAVMLSMVSERALLDLGTNTVYWLCFGQALLATLVIFLMTYGIANFSSMDGPSLVVDHSSGASGYSWGYNSDRPQLLAAALVLGCTFWACQFLSDITALTTSLSISGWFFTRSKAKYIPTYLGDLVTVWTHHAGTAALGSLVHTFTDGPHRFLASLDTLMASKLARGTGLNPIRALEQSAATLCTACLRYGTCGVVDNLLKYTSPNAYASVAMFGTGYWASAKTSFFLTIRNKERVGAAISVAQIVPTVGKVSATATTTIIFYFIQVWGFPAATPISMASSSIICGITSWLMCSQFVAPLTQAPSALLQCYMLDGEFYKSDARFAEKEMHAWVDTYGGEYEPYSDLS